jgi:hypothetical protein
MTLPRKRNVSALAVSLLLIGLYFYLWNHYAVNIPKWDDHPLKGFVIDYDKASTISEKINTITRQHNEHRIGLTRLATLIDFKLFGGVNYKHLMFFGNLALILIWLLLTRFFRQTIASFWYALPVVTFWFGLAFWENTFWGMASVQNMWVVALTLWSCWIIAQNNRYWAWGIVVAAVAFYTSGNGILALPIGLMVLLLQKNWLRAALFAVGSLVIFGSYFYQFQIPPVNGTAVFDFKMFAKGYLLLCGSLAEGLPFSQPQQSLLWVGFLTLFVSFCLLLYIFRSYVTKQLQLSFYDSFFLGATLFALLTIGIVSYSRAGVGLQFLLTSRYKLYSALLFSLNIAYLITLVSPKFRDALTATFLIIAGYLYVCNQHYHLYDTIQLRKYLITSHFNATDGVPDLEKSQVYHSPKLFTDNLPIIAFDSTSTQKPCKITNNQLVLSQPNYRLRDWRDGGLYLYLYNNQQRYLFPTNQARKHSFRNVLNYNRFFIKGSTVTVDGSEVKAGQYQLKWLSYSGKTFTLLPTDCQSVIFARVAQKEIKKNW